MRIEGCFTRRGGSSVQSDRRHDITRNETVLSPSSWRGMAWQRAANRTDKLLGWLAARLIPADEAQITQRFTLSAHPPAKATNPPGQPTCPSDGAHKESSRILPFPSPKKPNNARACNQRAYIEHISTALVLNNVARIRKWCAVKHASMRLLRFGSAGYRSTDKRRAPPTRNERLRREPNAQSVIFLALGCTVRKRVTLSNGIRSGTPECRGNSSALSETPGKLADPMTPILKLIALIVSISLVFDSIHKIFVCIETVYTHF